MNVPQSIRLSFLSAAAVFFSGCFQPYPYGAPPTGASEVANVPLYTQEKMWYCAPAVLRMWLAQLNGGSRSITQDMLWNFAASNYPSQVRAFWPGGGMSTVAAASTMSHFSGRQVQVDQYNFEEGIRQAIADQKYSLSVGSLVAAAINHGTHVVLVRGASWNKLSDALSRPRDETMKIHDPALRCRGATFTPQEELL